MFYNRHAKQVMPVFKTMDREEQCFKKKAAEEKATSVGIAYIAPLEVCPTIQRQGEQITEIHWKQPGII